MMATTTTSARRRRRPNRISSSSSSSVLLLLLLGLAAAVVVVVVGDSILLLHGRSRSSAEGWTAGGVEAAMAGNNADADAEEAAAVARFEEAAEAVLARLRVDHLHEMIGGWVGRPAI
jgi:Na+-driven multidrug efflux pump